ncbi:hypothetical protein [Bacteroides cellulosilyticus]
MRNQRKEAQLKVEFSFNLYIEFMHYFTYTLTLTFCIVLFIGNRVECR